MSVVYKIRHLRLNRVVAVQVILAVSLAGTSESVRFLAEAEAVAALQLPLVVALLSFSKHQGLPFFTLEFVPSDSLADRPNGVDRPGE